MKKRVGRSPDIADGFVILFYRPVADKRHGGISEGEMVGERAMKMPDHPNPYDDMDIGDLYD